MFLRFSLSLYEKCKNIIKKPKIKIWNVTEISWNTKITLTKSKLKPNRNIKKLIQMTKAHNKMKLNEKIKWKLKIWKQKLIPNINKYYNIIEIILIIWPNPSDHLEDLNNDMTA